LLQGIARCMLLISGLAFFSEPARAQHAFDPKATLEEYRRALPFLDKSYGQLRAEGDLTTEIRRGGQLDHAAQGRHLAYAANTPYAKLLAVTRSQPDVESTGYSEKVLVKGPGRTFILSKTREGGAWSIDSLDRFNAGWEYLFFSHVNGLFHAPCAMDAFLISELIRSPRFSATGGRMLSRDGRELVRLEFRVEAEGKAPGYAGWMLLEPSRQWIMHEYSYTFPGEPPRTFSGTISYSSTDKETPTPLRVVQSESSKPGKEVVNTFVFTRFSREDVALEEFNLSDFGLGELDHPMPRRSNTAIWWVVIGGASLVGLIITRRIARQPNGTT